MSKNDTLQDDAIAYIDSFLTPEEIAESNLRVALIGELIKARNERGVTQKQLEEMSGVSQPVIARLERGRPSPNISSVIKLLSPLVKKLAIVPLES